MLVLHYHTYLYYIYTFAICLSTCQAASAKTEWEDQVALGFDVLACDALDRSNSSGSASSGFSMISVMRVM